MTDEVKQHEQHDQNAHDAQVAAVSAQMTSARDELARAEDTLNEIDAAIDTSNAQRDDILVLQQAIDAVERVNDADLADLFWGESSLSSVRQLTSVKAHVADYQHELEDLIAQRGALAGNVDEHHGALDLLSDSLFDLQQERENELHEWVIERDATPRRKVAQVMPWARGLDEDRRFRQTLLRSVAASALLAVLITLIELPILERDELVAVPERFAKLIEKPRPAPPPVQPVRQNPKEVIPDPEKPEEVIAEKPPEVKPEVVEEVMVASQKQESTREKIATKGILAFRDSLSNLAQSRPSAKLGVDARINSAGMNASGRPQRNMVTTQASGSSGGINLAAVSRDLGEGGGGAMSGVQTTQVASSIPGTGTIDRPLSNGAGAGRTDEEIQIVFDRYKAALYRLYNRELRKDPTLRGQLVLQLTIEPDGSVSFIELRASDMRAPELAQQVVNRVRAFDFGVKDVPSVTIVYPIDFLPTA